METLITLFIIALMYRNTKAVCTELAECFDDVSHDQFNRLLNSQHPWQKLLWELFSQPRLASEGYLIIDDTVLEKFGENLFGVFWVYSSRLEKTVRGINLVVLIWTDGKRRIPVGIKIWRAGGPSKMVLASKLLRWAKRFGIRPKYVIFDSWYSSKELLKQILSYGWQFITRVKKNRLFNGKQLRKHWPHRFGHAQGKIVGGIEVLIVKDGKRYLTTSDMSLNIQEVKVLYAKRQAIEEFFKVMKSQLRWGQCSVRSKQGQIAHLHLCVMAYCILEEEGIRQGVSIYKVRRWLYRLPIPTQTPLFQPFIHPA